MGKRGKVKDNILDLTGYNVFSNEDPSYSIKTKQNDNNNKNKMFASRMGDGPSCETM